jgi:anti-sigma factor RsiW
MGVAMRIRFIVAIGVVLALFAYSLLLFKFALELFDLPTFPVLICLLIAIAARLKLTEILAISAFVGLWQGTGMHWVGALLIAVPAFVVDVPRSIVRALDTMLTPAKILGRFGSERAAASGRKSPLSLPGFRDRKLVEIGALALAAFLVGWASHSIPDPTADSESVADEAQEIHQTALLRTAAMTTSDDNRDELNSFSRRTGIKIPNLPANWHIKDVQLVDTDYGIGIHLAAVSADGTAFTLVAVHERAPERSPSMYREENDNIAYWNRNDLGYAVVSDAPAHLVETVASELNAG